MVHPAQRELYPIRSAESMPSDLAPIIENPVFLAPELTFDLVKARVYTGTELGDNSGRATFGVLYGGIVVSIDTKGLGARAIRALVRQLGH